MEQFENNQIEAEKNPQVIKARLSELHNRAKTLQELAAKHNENVDVEPGSEEYIDFGYTIELREEVLPEITRLEERLRTLEDQEASQRPLL